MIQKFGSARWSGGLRDGQGTLSTETGSLSDQPYSFAKRFGDEKGTNPEELIGAAHASCFAMQMSAFIEQAGTPARSIEAKSTVTLTVGAAGADITRVHVDVVADVPGISAEQFQEIAERTKAGCPVSKVLAGADITMAARLAGA
jgi:osmotically inducible protein OsmC